ncbi:MAG: T9SS type A sorting domain-containing protein [Bacteroidetes bacterium]|nr:T9SS type A sorting domain-containing protein [Bacteroidota bacterium]
MNKKHLLILILLFSGALYSQPTLSLDWADKDPIATGTFIQHDSQNTIITVGRQGTNIFGSYVNLYIEKHDTIGNSLWTQIYSDNVGFLFRPKDMWIDSYDNIYVMGRSGSFSQSAQGFIIKYNSQGNFQWLRYFGDAQGLVGEFNAMTVYNDQFIYIAGKMDSLSGNGVRKSVLVKYDSFGNLLWFTMDSSTDYKEGICAEVDGLGNIYLVGSTTCCPPGSDTFIEKYDSLGNKIWETVIQDSAYQYGVPNTTIIDDSANVYIGASIEGLSTTTGFDCGTLKIDSSGILKWMIPFYSDTNSNIQDIPKGILIDKSFNTYTYGISVGNGFNRGFIVKYDINGNQKWKLLGKDTTGGYWYLTLKAKYLNDSTIILGASGGYLSNGGNAVTLSIDTSGFVNWQLGTPFYGNFYDFEYFNNSSYYTGFVRDPNSIVEDSLFTIKLNYNTGLSVRKVALNSFVTLFPNPASNVLNVILDNKINQKVNIRMFNSLGQKVISASFLTPNVKFDISTLSSGIYWIEIDIGTEIFSRKIIKL